MALVADTALNHSLIYYVLLEFYGGIIGNSFTVCKTLKYTVQAHFKIEKMNLILIHY